MANPLFPFFNTPIAICARQFASAVLAGIGGNIVLIYFIGGLASAETMVHLLPWIVGFNTCLSGYMLVERSGADLSYRRALSAAAGLVNAAVTVLSGHYLYTLTAEFPLNPMTDAVLLLVIGAVCATLGGMLAKKNMELRGNNNP